MHRLAWQGLLAKAWLVEGSEILGYNWTFYITGYVYPCEYDCTSILTFRFRTHEVVIDRQLSSVLCVTLKKVVLCEIHIASSFVCEAGLI